MNKVSFEALSKSQSVPGEIKVLYNHIYEYKKGIRPLILYTIKKEYMPLVIERLQSQDIAYFVQDAGSHSSNIYFGNKECINAIEMIITKPLNHLTPEEDFILGALLGYDLRMQCERFCSMKERAHNIV